MCNIAGYIGTKEASPILFDMIKRQEGYAGGYYAGIAVLDNGKISCRKLTGKVEMLERDTDALALSGKLGIIHSRSNAGGPDAWAHPFVATRNGEAVTAYAAVGSNGFFSSRRQEFDDIANELFSEGFEMSSGIHGIESEIYPTMPDGAKVHMSDVMCQLVFKYILEGNTGEAAMAKAFCRMPGEIIGLNVNKNEPDRITWAKISEALFVSFSEHGAYVSSSPEGFPEDAGDVHILPPNSSGCIFKDHYTVVPFEKAPCTVRGMDASIVKHCYDEILNILEAEQSLYPVWDKLKLTLSGADCYQISSLLYVVIEALKKEGKIALRTVEAEGAKEGVTAYQFMMKRL